MLTRIEMYLFYQNKNTKNASHSITYISYPIINYSKYKLLISVHDLSLEDNNCSSNSNDRLRKQHCAFHSNIKI